MPTTWVDFKELRSRVRIADVLVSYKIEVKVKGDRATGFCPLPGHNGQRRSPSFSVHLGKNIWKCFGCQRGGNVIDLVAIMEGLDPANHADIRKAALKMAERFGIHSTGQRVEERRESSPPAATEVDPIPTVSPTAPQNVWINAPLDFALKGLDASHPYLSSRGFNLGTVGCFGLGYCAKGLMTGRIAIPLHDEAGKLIGYAGRLVDDAKINEENPKYRFPSGRERDGVRFEFHKSLFLYNGHHLPQPVSDLIVVEGFASTWWLWQAGYSNVVAVMGANCSPEQAALIVQHVIPDGLVWVFPDGDSAGEKMAVSVFQQVAPHRAVQFVKLGAGKQPTDRTPDELANIFGPPKVAEESDR